MSSDSRSYVLKKSRRLAMLPAEIQRLVDATPRKPRRIIKTFEEVLYSLAHNSIQITKPNDKFWLTEWQYDCPAAPHVFWKSVKQDIKDIMTYMQQLGMAQEFHSQNVKLLLEAVTKHFSWQSEYPFLENDLELRACISKALKKPTVPINKQPYWVLQNWDDIMAFMMCGTHLDKEVHTTGDLSHPIK